MSVIFALNSDDKPVHGSGQNAVYIVVFEDMKILLKC